MRDIWLAAALTILAATTLAASPAWADLLLWRMEHLPGAGSLLDIGYQVPVFLFGSVLGERTSVLLVSWLGWFGVSAALTPGPLAKRAAEALNPAAIFMAAAGLGVTAAAILILFRVVMRVLESSDPRHVPSLGLGVLLAAASIPHFTAIALPLASGLFLIAPRPMVRQDMTSFYLITLGPTLVLLAASAFFADAVPRAATPATLIASPGLLFAGPILGLTLIAARAWRLTALLSLVIAGVVSSPLGSVLWPLALAALAGGLIARRGDRPWIELSIGITFAVAAAIIAADIPG